LAYRIEYKSSIANDLRKIDKKEAKRIIDKIEKDLTEDPAYGTPLKGRMCFELETRTNDCFKLKGYKDFIQTHGHRGSKDKWQNDYIFISKSISKKFVDCKVVDIPEVRRYSDHNIVMVTLNL